MNDADAEAQKTRVLAVAEPWMEALWLKWWNIEWRWHRGRIDGESDVTAMATSADWEYAEAVISVDLTRIEDWGTEELEKVVVHELMHVILHEARYWKDDLGHEERVASWLQRAFLTVRAHTTTNT